MSKRALGFIGAALLASAAVGWTLLWNLAAGQSEKIVEAWILRERSFGRIWSCPARTIGGFPFAIEMACSKPGFGGMMFGRHFAGNLGGFRATADVFHPTAVTVRLGAPFAVSADTRDANFELAWQDLRIVLDGLPQKVWRVTISGDTLSWHGALEELGSVSGDSARLAAEAASRAEDGTYDFNVAIDAARLSDLDRLLGKGLPADIAAHGTVTKAAFDPNLTLPQNMDNWRRAGGELELADLSLTQGATKFSAHGSLGLDDLHRVEGKLETESRGFEPLLLRLGVNPVLVSAGTLLSGLLGGAPPEHADAQPDALLLPIAFDDGYVSIGPAQTSIRLPALY